MGQAGTGKPQSFQECTGGLSEGYRRRTDIEPRHSFCFRASDRPFIQLYPYAPNGGDLLYMLLFIIIRINCLLCVFNLLPIPPLDGYQILKSLIPARYGSYLHFFEQYQLIFLFILILVPGASAVITIPSQALYRLMTDWITLLR